MIRTIYFVCGGCEHSFVAQLTILHSVRPSERPDPSVDLPLRVAATLKPFAVANDFAANEPGIAEALEKLDQIAS